MKQIEVNVGEKKYPIVVTKDFLHFREVYKSDAKQCLVITDSNVCKFHLNPFVKEIRDLFQQVHVCCLNEGEATKSLSCAEQVYKMLIKNKFSRSDLIIGLGGGVIGDLAGFVASTYMRGISLVHVPTSLLAQVDSSIGGKTAINIDSIKNIVGSFYQPQLVYNNYTLLKTLFIEDIRNGLVEILVHALIKDKELFIFIEENLDKIFLLDDNVMEDFIIRNCIIKKNVIENDVYDIGERAILNFGHTFGHAIESALNYQYKHGECVAWGILCAYRMAEKLNMVSPQITNRVYCLLRRMEVLKSIKHCDKQHILSFMLHDKKVTLGKLLFILPVDIGCVQKQKIEDMKLVSEVIDSIIDI